MKNVYVISCLAILFLVSSCQKDPSDEPFETSNDPAIESELNEVLSMASNEGKEFFKLPDADNLSAIPQDPNNPITPTKVKLGQLLYHETAIGITPENEIGVAKYSCASCHFASAGFQACRVQGIGEGGVGFGHNGEGRTKGAFYSEAQVDVQPLRSPSAMNIAYQKNVLWNGQFGATGVNEGTESQWTADTPKETNHLGFEGTEIQAIAGLKVHRMDVSPELMESLGYKTMFDEAFASVEESERYTRVTAGLAIAAYERTLLANEAPFQRWLNGDATAMTDEEKKGAILFFDKAQCVDCHTGPALNSMEFHAYGMKDLHDCNEQIFLTPDNDPAHLGRGSFTGNAADNYKFKVPQLYNLSDSPFYGHGSSFRDLEEVIFYKNMAISQNPDVPSSQLSEHFIPLNLSTQEIKEITAFLQHSLHDPNLKRYEPESVLSGNCFPFSDPLAAYELGCE